MRDNKIILFWCPNFRGVKEVWTESILSFFFFKDDLPNMTILPYYIFDSTLLLLYSII